jgi:hypothetical protein
MDGHVEFIRYGSEFPVTTGDYPQQVQDYVLRRFARRAGMG